MEEPPEKEVETVVKKPKKKKIVPVPVAPPPDKDPPPLVWNCVIPKGSTSGVTCDTWAEGAQVLKINGGIFSAYNSKAEEGWEIRDHDFILRANGKTGKEVVDVLNSGEELHLKVAHSQRFDIKIEKIDKGGKWGLHLDVQDKDINFGSEVAYGHRLEEVQASEGGLEQCCRVKHVLGSLGKPFEDHNAYCPPELRVKEGFYIEKVNGTKGSAIEVIKATQGIDAMVLSMLRIPTDEEANNHNGYIDDEKADEFPESNQQ